jgi:hypothetical protein
LNSDGILGAARNDDWHQEDTTGNEIVWLVTHEVSAAVLGKENGTKS